MAGDKGAGWLHQVRESSEWEKSQPVEKKHTEPPPPDMGPMSLMFQRDLTGEQLGTLVEELGLSVDAMTRMRVGFSRKHQAYTFPMQHAGGQVTGIRLRHLDGSKKSVYGGREGIFVPRELRDLEWLFIAEGPTDTAALLDLEFSAVGRPSCSGGVPILAELVRKWRPEHVVILSDNDDPESHAWNGTQTLAKKLVLLTEDLRVVVPPEGVKDARRWKNNFGARLEIKQRIAATQPFTLEQVDA